MKRKFLWTALWLLSLVFAFLAGSTTGRQVALKSFAIETENANAGVNLGHYVVYRDIAVDIKAGRSKEAKCKAEMIASSLFDGAKQCAGTTGCRDSIEKEARKMAPEVISNGPPAFDYVPAVKGVRRCPDQAAR